MNRLTDAELEAMAGHTDGPWDVDNYGDIHVNGLDIAMPMIGFGDEMDAANSALLVAAPAMYAELLERRAMDAVVREALEEIGENTDLPLYSAAAVMELVEALEIARIHVAASAGASHMLEGFGPTRKTRDDLHLQMVDAALAPYREKTDAAE